MSDLPDSGHRTNFNTGAVRDASEGKGHPSSIPPTAIRRIAKRFEDGARKYKNHNWAQGMPLSRTADSAMRHITSFLEGDKTEDHLGAAAWNLCVLMQFEEWLGKGLLPDELDDRLYAKENPVAWAREQCAEMTTGERIGMFSHGQSIVDKAGDANDKCSLAVDRSSLAGLGDYAETDWEIGKLNPWEFTDLFRLGKLKEQEVTDYINGKGRPLCMGKDKAQEIRCSVDIVPGGLEHMTNNEYVLYTGILAEKHARDQLRLDRQQNEIKNEENQWSEIAQGRVKGVAEELQENRHMVRMDTIREGLQSIQDNPTGRYAVVLRHDLSNYIGVFIKQRDAEKFMAHLAAATIGYCEFDIIALP